ncbi:MAG: phage holin family protein [Saprospiraceae bacterium]|nr:phage holin family protein [Saprospiraceae bacterium]
MKPDADPDDMQGPSARLEQLTDQLLDHLETRWEYATLTFAEKMSALLSNLAGMIVALAFALMVLMLLCVALALWLGDLIGNKAGGFALSSLILIPIGALAFYVIRPLFREKIIQNMLSDEDLPKES